MSVINDDDDEPLAVTAVSGRSVRIYTDQELDDSKANVTFQELIEKCTLYDHDNEN